MVTCCLRRAIAHFIGTRSGLEQGYPGDRDLTFHGISAGKTAALFFSQNLTDVFRIIWAVIESLVLLLRIRPSVLFSKGGFVSLPPVFAAWLLRIPVVAHESDLTPGLANRLSLPFIHTLCTSFADTRFAGFAGRRVVTGTPVRHGLLTGDVRGRKALEIEDDSPQKILLVTGGSLGAENLNRIIRDNLEALTGRFLSPTFAVGKIVAMKQQDYLQLEFVDDGWGDLLAAADIVISRAGANALFEWVALAKLNLAALPLAGSRGDQIANAQYAQEHGWSEVLEEQDLTPKALLQALDCLESDPARYRQAMGSMDTANAAEQLLDEIQRFAEDPLSKTARS